MGLGDTRRSVEGVRDAVDAASDSIELLTESVVEGGREFELMTNAVNSSVAVLASLGTALEDIGNNIPVLQQLGGVVNLGVSAITGLVGSVTALSSTFYEGMGALDAMSAGHRALYSEMFEVGSQFGKTFDESRKFGQNILVVAAAIKGADFGWLKSENLIETANSLSNAGVNIERFGDSIESSAGRMDLLTAATLQSSSSGLVSSDYFNKLSDAMLKQGLSSEEAMKQISSFKDVSDSTGLSVRSIADSLNSLGNSFSRIGLSADFGRPLLKGFSDTISDMGLGIENAIQLSSSLSTSLAGLATDYSTMYVTAQRGNMQDMMGGGALSAGFQFQTKLLDAEGDPEAQAKLGQEMAMALKDTIASFSGGEIVTAREAAVNPELATQAYTQQKLLEQMYGLDDQTALRTLDLLDSMGKAINSGDANLADSLGRDLQEAITTNNETTDLQDKANAYLSGILAQAMVTNESLFVLGRETIGNAMLNEINQLGDKGLASFEEIANSNRKNMDELINKGKTGDVNLNDYMVNILNTALGRQTNIPDDGKDNPTRDITKFDDIYSSIESLVSSNFDLTSSIAKLISRLDSDVATSYKKIGIIPGTTGYPDE